MGMYLVSTGDSKGQRRIGKMEVVRTGIPVEEVTKSKRSK